MNAATHDFEEEAAVPPGERLDIKAYDLWTRCHHGGRVPSQQELLGHEECDFVDHAVLIRIADEDTTPTISHIGTQLWLGLDGILPQDIGEVPARSVLSRITEHYLQAVANRTAVGFEAEFVNQDGSVIGYRAIALPCSGDGVQIDAVLGVVDYSLVDDDALEPRSDEDEGGLTEADRAAPMPKEGWRAVIAKMRRDPDEPVADEKETLPLPAGAEPEPVAIRKPDGPKHGKPRKRQALDPLPQSHDTPVEGVQPEKDNTPVSGTLPQGRAVRAALDQLLRIEGAIAAALVELDSGMPLASAGDAGDIDLDIAVAGNTEVLRAKGKALRALGTGERVEDIMITLTSQYHLLRPLASDEGLFLCLVVDSGRATLAMARHELRRVERALAL